MNKEQLPLDVAILQKIIDGKGTIDEILSLKKDYRIDIIEINKILQDFLDNDVIMRTEDKFIIKL